METINITPTWSAIVPALVAVLENPEAGNDAKQVVREEFVRMAKAADQWNSHVAKDDR